MLYFLCDWISHDNQHGIHYQLRKTKLEVSKIFLDNIRQNNIHNYSYQTLIL